MPVISKARGWFDQFAPVSKETLIGYPEVLAAQPDYGMEWWYLTGHLSNGTEPFGFELTFFRVGVNRTPTEGPFGVRDLFFAHFAVTDIAHDRFLHAERSSRGALGEAGSRSDRLDVWNGPWRVYGDGALMHLSAEDPEFEVDLQLVPRKPPVFQGDHGYSQKGEVPEDASYYVSLPRIAAEGRVRVGKRIIPVSGEAWMDREIMTPVAESEVRGWDWFAIQMEDGREMMLYQIYTDEGISKFSRGALVGADAHVQRLASEDILITPEETWKSPVTGVRYHTAWSIRVPRRTLSIDLRAYATNQEFIASKSTGNAYWEGACHVQGTWEGQVVAGKAYVEMNREKVRKFAAP